MDRDELLSALYGDEEETSTAEKKPIESPGFNRTRKVRVGAVEYELPTVEYVNRLEQMVVRQAHIIDQQKTAIERLQGFVISTRNFIRRQTNLITTMRESIDSKVDMKDYL